MDKIYAVIDLGSSHIRGMLAIKQSDERISPIAYCSEPSNKSIRRGAVHNIEETARIIKNIVERLNSKLEKNTRIEAIYVGVGAQTLASKEHIITQTFATDGEVVNQDHIDKLWEQVRSVNLGDKEILDISEPIYYLDDKQETLAKGLFCNKLEARFQLITARPSVSRNIRIAVEEMLQLRLAGILINPIWEAKACLSDEVRNIGCAYINIGAGTSSVSIYKNGLLMRFNTIPFGGDIITRDLTCFHISEQEAESLKRKLVNMTPDKNSEVTTYLLHSEDEPHRELRISEVNHIAQKRMEEITVNLINVINLSGYIDSINAGLFINGGGAKLRNYRNWLKQNAIRVQKAQLKKQIIKEDNPLVFEEEAQSLIALCLGAKENCVEIVAQNLEQMMEEIDSPQEPEPSRQPATNPTRNKGKRRTFSFGSIFNTGTDMEPDDDQEYDDQNDHYENEEAESAPSNQSGGSSPGSNGFKTFLNTIGNLFDNEINDKE